MKRVTFLFVIFLFAILQGNAQVRALDTYPDPDKEKLLKMSERFHQRHLVRKAELQKVAKERGWKIRHEDTTGVHEIMYLDKRGFPRMYQTTNINAGRTTNTDDIWQGGSTGLNLTGNGYIVAEWDGGGVLATHQEFNNGDGSRVTQVDGIITTHYHSTHVAGTIIAKGLKPIAHGMATEALLHAYDWNNDESEMSNEASDGLILSNHSYGQVCGWDQDNSSGAWLWLGDTTVSRTEDFMFGFYDDLTRDWDEIASAAPRYLIVNAAGNDRNDVHAGGHYVYNGINWVWSSWPRDRDGGVDGYDCISQPACAKNILTVGAVNDIPLGWASAANVVQSSFSSWGPTDDGRIKPDLVANGVDLLSTDNTTDTSYASHSGTSMAAPNTTGTLVLLQEYYDSLRGGTMSAAALKGLAINTANEAGANAGPDYQNGWGLLNASGAANLITADNSEGGQIVQGILRSGQTVDYNYYSNGASSIVVTICWTDPPGTPPAPSLNPPDLMLVNDLDIRLIKSGVYTLPWRLNPASPANAATRADNFRDNVEVINITNPSAGYYTIRVSHKGALAEGQQAYALIVRGMTTTPVDSYCSARSTNWNSYENISRVTFGSIDNSSERSPGGYHDYTGLVNKMTKGASESLTVTINGYPGDYGRVWIDWNQDGDFSDAGETFNLGTGTGPVYSLNIPVPMSALTGYTTMRVRLNYGAYPSACGTISYGETEDYAIEVLSQCEAGGNGREYISWVNAGSINNSSGSNTYSNYTSTHSTSLPANGVVHVTVNNGSLMYNEDQCGIWVDWNNNSSFLDAGEQIVVTGTPGTGPYTATIIPPEGVSLGSYTMRLRITYTGAVSPCGITGFGEVEDYTLNLTAPVINQWIGNTSHNWFEPMNWSLEHVPYVSDDVTINTGYTYNPVIPIGVATCNNLTIGAGAKISLGVADLEIGGDMTIMGQVDATSSSADYMVSGSVYWDAGSTANITDGEFRVEGDWEYSSDALANLTNGTVLFTGSGNQYIRNYTAACSFNHLTNDKSTGILYVSPASSDTLKINGNLRNNGAGSILNCRSSHPVVLKGSFTNNGHIYCPSGTFIFGGTTHSINLNTGDYFKNLIIKSTGNTSLADSLRVQGNLTISGGALVAGAWPILIAGNWTNSVNPAAFSEGTGKVVFNGSGDQNVVGSEDFNILELNMGGKLKISNATQNVTCNHYLWTSGGLEVQAGSFSADNLAQEGIYGNFWLHSGGTINLTNDDVVDVNGFLHIYGGTFNIQGLPGGVSYFSYLANSGIEMSGGTLDFKNVGIGVIDDGFTFSENITGGSIKTIGEADIQRADFSPSGGTLELYGQTGGFLRVSNGAWLHNLIVNKTAGTNIVVYGNLDINGDLTITSGTLDSWSYNINIAGNWQNSVGSQGFDEGTGMVTFDGGSAKQISGSENFYNLTVNKSFSGYNGLSLNNEITVQNNLTINDGCIEMDDPAELLIGGNITISSGAGLNANDPYGAHITVAKNWINHNTGYAAESGFSPENSTVIFYGTTDQYITSNATEEVFHHLIIESFSASVRTNDNLIILGNLQIINGTWEDNMAGLTHKISGNFSLSPGTAFNALTNGNTIEFTGSGNSSIFNNSSTSVFRNLKINKTNGASVTQYGNMDLVNNGNLTIQQGRYLLNASTVSVSGNVAVNMAGILSMGHSCNLIMNTHAADININQGGKLEIVANSAHPATIGVTGTERWYNLNVYPGGVIAAENCVFTNPGINGINIAAGAVIDPLHTFTGCTFQNGFPGGTLLTINNDQELIIRDAVFPVNSFGSVNNVTKTLESGHVYYLGFSGPFSGEAFDNDPFDRIDWVLPMATAITTSQQSICAGGSSQLTCEVSGGVPNYTYSWSPATGLSDPTIPNPLASPLETCTYWVTVTDNFDSTSVASVTVTVHPVLPASVTITASANPSPPGSLVDFWATPVNGGGDPFYSWKVNGVATGVDISEFHYVPSNNDQISCEMFSIYTCPSISPALSNLITMVMVNISTVVTGEIQANEVECYNASGTITVGGEGTPFTVDNGGSATMIAGQKILYLPGTTVLSGGYMHGYITPDNTYCGNLPPMMASVQTGTKEPEPEPEQSSLFTIFPNPAQDQFTLMYKGELAEAPIMVEILDLQGTVVKRDQISGDRSKQFRLGDYSSGLYLVKVNINNHYESLKLILNK